jgi:hypothetical protein
VPIDVLVAAILINRRIAIPILAAVWSFGHASSEINQEFGEGFVVAAVYAAIGFGVRRLIGAEVRDFLAERKSSQEPKQ